ncbi:MAG: hypothetical protein ACRDT6_29165 [Micromonosporaceae bacterium]
MRSLRGAVALLAVVAVLVAGCGYDGVEPREWASRVCQALVPWGEEIASLTSETQKQMSQTTSPKQAKQNIVALLKGAEQSSEDARKGVQVAGVPAVEDGERIAKEFRDALKAARDAYGKARRSVEKLSAAEAGTFYDGVVDAMDQLSQDYDASELDTSEVSSEELQEAFDEVPECQ